SEWKATAVPPADANALCPATEFTLAQPAKAMMSNKRPTAQNQKWMLSRASNRRADHEADPKWRSPSPCIRIPEGDYLCQRHPAHGAPLSEFVSHNRQHDLALQAHVVRNFQGVVFWPSRFGRQTRRYAKSAMAFTWRP